MEGGRGIDFNNINEIERDFGCIKYEILSNLRRNGISRVQRAELPWWRRANNNLPRYHSIFILKVGRARVRASENGTYSASR